MPSAADKVSGAHARLFAESFSYFDIRRLRVARGLSQEALAVDAEIDHAVDRVDQRFRVCSQDIPGSEFDHRRFS
jgi:hypothetical protein